MYYTDKLDASKLFVVLPSIIIRTKNIEKQNLLYKRVIFEREATPKLAYLKNTMLKLIHFPLDNNNQIIYPNTIYNENNLRRLGIINDPLNKEFINVFDGDITLLSDYLFACSIDNTNMYKRLKYFKYPFSPDNKELKTIICNRYLTKKTEYSIEELKAIKEYLNIINEEQKTKEKEYKIPNQSKQLYLVNIHSYNKKPLYAITKNK